MIIICLLGNEKDNIINLLIISVIFTHFYMLVMDVLFNEFKNNKKIDLIYLGIGALILLDLISLCILSTNYIINYFYAILIIVGISTIILSLVIHFMNSDKSKIRLNFRFTIEIPEQQDVLIKPVNIKTNNKFIEKYGLTKREYEVLLLIGKGMTSIEISEKMFLSKKTIDYYRSIIKDKLAIKKKSDLIEFINYHSNIAPQLVKNEKILEKQLF